MTDPGFRIEGRQQTAPFMVRATFSDYHYFGDAKCAVLVEPKTARAMSAAAAQALPRETGGLLSGRALRDDLGGYVVVSGFIEAPPSAGRPAAFQITTRELGDLRLRAARANPGADEVGWWHTHRAPSSYSQTDRNTQRMFERPDSVGLLVFASGSQWAIAYVGPDALDLGYPVAQKQKPAESAGHVDPAHPPGRAAYSNGGAAPAGPASGGVLTIPSPPREGRSRISGQALLLIILALVIAGGLILFVTLLVGLSNISGRVGGLQQTMSSQLRQLGNLDSGNYNKISSQIGGVRDTPTAAPSPVSAPSPAVTAASVSWSCVHAGHGLWTCTAASSPGTSQWQVVWVVDGKRAGPGRDQVPIAVTKSEGVRAVLVSPAGTDYPGPMQTLSP